MKAKKMTNDRRKKLRFPIEREVRYKLLEEGKIVAQGQGQTLNVGSGGVAFQISGALPLGSYVELSVSWPILLEGACPMQLTLFGRVARFSEGKAVCTVEKWEFRTRAREMRRVIPMRADDKLLRWVEYRKEVAMKAAVAAVAASA